MEAMGRNVVNTVERIIAIVQGVNGCIRALDGNEPPAARGNMSSSASLPHRGARVGNGAAPACESFRKYRRYALHVYSCAPDSE